MKTTLVSALTIAAALAAGPAFAQSDSNSSTSGKLPAECNILGPALDQQTIDRIQDLNERRQALSCMVGTPRDYKAELSSRPSGGDVNSVDVEKSWGSDTVAQGLEQSAKDNAAVTGDLQTALQSDKQVNSYMQKSNIDVADIIGYVVGPTGTVTLIVAPSMSDNTATGSTSAGSKAMSGDADKKNETTSN